ncbi:HlyD family efflux transporter periplasmic adaptor subunit [Chitinivorax sp. B]|uniref:HlyD family secretion protein n=1 Tax=Chitinivorax sp. B TaxID=2502235 RepID=UPI0010F49795|nr:HlyD family efflux transporter periplasmic adaptor subunit [Chitinivorax sp. B]
MRNCLAWILMSVGLVGCGEPTVQTWQGYVEGEYLYLSSPVSGYLQGLNTSRGGRVQSGQVLFSIAAELETAGLQEAQAREQAARAKVDNLRAPRRASEVAAVAAQLKAAEAALKLSESQLKQQQALAVDGFVSSARLDEARTIRNRDAAQVASMREQLTSARITIGRQAEVRSADAEAAAAGALVAQRRWQVDKKAVLAPTVGEVVETYYRIGEWVPAGQPVASILPDDHRKIRFYVPETQLAQLRLGQGITAHCDGCKTPIQAKITFIAAQPEYTPPLIYSRENRAKLVFRAEAQPARELARQLRPGLPLDIRAQEP